eukprot:TRINITY_DN827_c0_g2_i1.p1 TRINITY_DN827_c0_g2~~TRINITY_DN827_c0_g2_i1.p1  ORF type:complete len:888 (-),score=454.20 TRINITY_DN827_c0_g2_i1:2225-4780(-)
MGSLYRSKAMQLVQLFMQLDAAHDTLDELGKIGAVQFRDLNPDVTAFQRNFINEIRTVDEMERILRYFHDQCLKLKDLDGTENVLLPGPVPVDELNNLPPISELVNHFRDLENELSVLTDNQSVLDRNLNELIELKWILEKASSLFDENPIMPEILRNQGPGKGPELNFMAGGGDIESAMNFSYTIGAIARSKVPSFEKILWRVMRGNLYLKIAEIDDFIRDPVTNELMEKSVFLIFHQGVRAKTKVEKICDAFQANLSPCPNNEEERRGLYRQIVTRIEDLTHVIRRTSLHRRQVLSAILVRQDKWKEYILKEKGIYHSLNMCDYDVGRKCLIAEAWVPTEAIDVVRDALNRGSVRAGTTTPAILRLLPNKGNPPTYQPVNSFTSAFQDIIYMYGVARYQEANPTPFTIVTFPFLFGIMFGDIGHGFLMTLLTLYILFAADSLYKNGVSGMMKNLVDSRYLLFFMALGAVFGGIMYNEIFGLTMDIFGSAYTWDLDESHASRVSGYVYPIGVDPAWKLATNELDFYNSLKMKMSVVIGVVQMSVGIFVSLTNHIHFKNKLSIFFEFIPQILFLWSIFGYMCFLIVFKWLTDYSVEGAMASPRLLNLMISMLLSPFKLDPQYYMYHGQHGVQLVLVIIAAISVPWMLIPKPVILFVQHKLNQRRRQRELEAFESSKDVELSEIVETNIGDSFDPDNLKKPHAAPAKKAEEHHDHHHGGDDDEEEHFELDEVVIHQVIHTIEFVLGCVSNTASYLRLWALSLAHSELSKVFWDHVMMMGFGMDNFFMIFICWGVWAGLTIGVLMMMESMSASLHALRLHWVEFQNKFYVGDGYIFEPFSYKVIADQVREGTV